MNDSLPTEEAVRAILRTVDDPEVGMNIVDLGLVYGIEIAPQQVRVAITMTTPACPMGESIEESARRALSAALPAEIGIAIELVWDPPWSPEMMSEHARQTFGWHG